MAVIGDTDLKVGEQTVEVISLAIREGVTVRTWGPHANVESSLALTTDEALALANALILAATTSVRFRAGCGRFV